VGGGEGERKLAAILSADVVGYSRLMEDDERATVRTLTDYRDVFRDHILRHRGRVVDAPGDNLLADFASPVEAVECAVHAQREIARRNGQLADHRRMDFRIGINLGDVLVKDGALYGDGVNIAARLEALGEAGGVCVSGKVFDEVKSKVAFGFDYFGENQFKNIAEPVRVYHVAIEAPVRSAAVDGRDPAIGEKATIAVLPFDNMSGDPEQEYFSDGITEDLITALSRIHWLFVTARNSTFTFKGTAVDVKHVAEELGVRYVVEGSVRKAGNRIRVTAQLIDATTGGHVWARHYDRELSDVFALQDEISDTITAALQPELAGFERERAHRKRPDNLDAWESYQRGLWHVYQFSGEENETARGLFRRAIELDPGFGGAYMGLGYTFFLDTIFGWGGGADDNIQQSFRATKKALTLDNRDAMAHYVLGRLYMLLGDQESALAESEQAIELNPSLALGHFGLGHALMLMGRPNDAMAELDIAMRLSPRDPIMWVFECTKATALVLMDDFDQALDYARRAARHANTGLWASVAMTSVLGHLGRAEEAGAALRNLLGIKPDFAPEFIRTYLPFDRQEDHEQYVAGLRKAGLDISEEPMVSG